MSVHLIYYLLAHGQYVWAEFHRYHYGRSGGWLEWLNNNRPTMNKAHTTCVAHLRHGRVVVTGRICR